MAAQLICGFQGTGFVVSGSGRFDDAEALESATGLTMRVTHEIRDDGSEVHHLRVQNAGRAPVSVERAGLRIPCPVGEGQWRVFLDGGTLAWAGVRRLEEPCEAGSMYAAGDERHVASDGRPIIGHHSSMLTALGDANGGSALLAGFLGQKEGLNFIDIWPDETGRGVLELEAWGEFAPRPTGGRAVPSPLELAPGASLELDPLLIRRGNEPLALLEDYGRQVQAHHGRSFDEPPIVGLMTWYARASAADETLVAGNLPILADLFNGYPQPMRNVLIVDHGWQQDAALGPTQADRQRFPHGLAWLSAEARRHGVELGLWHSTTHVTPDAGNYAQLEPMVVRDAQGQPLPGSINIWGHIPGDHYCRTVHAPDAARQDVRQWWTRQLGELASLGVGYFKLDFFATRTSEINRARVSTRELMDGAYQAFRTACPPGTHLAPCSCDSNLQLGRCDSVRIGSDIGEAGSWPAGTAHYRQGLSSIASMWFKQRRFWINDPDSAQIGKGCSLGEARVRATAAAFAGGHLMAGEDLRTVSPERLEILRRLLPAYPVAARPLDLFDAPAPKGYPSVWALPGTAAGQTRQALALFNLEPHTRRFTVTADMLGLAAGVTFAAYEWWQCRYLGVHDGRLEVEVSPGDVAVVHATPIANHPVLVSISHHPTGWYIVEDCRWDGMSKMLRGTLLTKPGLLVTLCGHAPQPWRLTTAGRFEGSCGADGNWQYVIRTQAPRTTFEVPFDN